MFSNSFESFDDDAVCLVNDGGIETGEVDLGGGFAVVAHTLGDY